MYKGEKEARKNIIAVCWRMIDVEEREISTPQESLFLSALPSSQRSIYSLIRGFSVGDLKTLYNDTCCFTYMYSAGYFCIINMTYFMMLYFFNNIGIKTRQQM